jgi:hypothetical protein
MPKNQCPTYYFADFGSDSKELAEEVLDHSILKLTGGGSCARKDHIGMYRM